MSIPINQSWTDAQVMGLNYRFTVLTSRLIRMEHSPDGVFVDAPTQFAVNRQFEVPEFSVKETTTSVEIITEHVRVVYDRGPFTPSGLSVSMRNPVQSSHRTTWHYGDEDRGLPGRPGNLGGTARTLDDVDGAIELAPGILSANGFAVVDDSSSLLLTDDKWVSQRPTGAGQDLYFFGYGRHYEAALRDYFRLAGHTPLLPRYALGNWWSRFHQYSDTEYLSLMDRFKTEGIPFSVAVIDMDWHLVDIDPRFGSGWTGYSWNRALFPDPAEFLAALRERDLRVTLNVHPADGVRAHEEAYPLVAQDLGLDPATEEEIAFDISSRPFVESYLARLHHPHEAIGVDFWWLDWQSGSYSAIPGLDPLWVLNYVHFHDSGRDGNRALTFSRYAGQGSHRYPIGFSGDTVTSWDSLAFQPEFTATASNVGYFWWSHDIGGHLGGAKDNELATRWFQLGVFSPINRLHSTSSAFNSKEPWRFSPSAEEAMVRFLRLRHQLVPYLYTANWLAHAEGKAPLRPIYYENPYEPDAYNVPNQYFFGEALMVAPITSKVDLKSRLARVDAWLPPGIWFDILDHRRYDAGSTGRRLGLHRGLDAIPVLARAGAILALAADQMKSIEDNPVALNLFVYAGESGHFTLLEDDGAGSANVDDRHETEMRWTWSDHGYNFTISPPRGPGVLTQRELTIEFVGVADARVTLRAGNHARPVALHTVRGKKSLRVDLGSVDLSQGIAVSLNEVQEADPDARGQVFQLLDSAEINYEDKERALRAVDLQLPAAIGALEALDLGASLYGALVEALTASFDEGS